MPTKHSRCLKWFCPLTAMTSPPRRPRLRRPPVRPRTRRPHCADVRRVSPSTIASLFGRNATARVIGHDRIPWFVIVPNHQKSTFDGLTLGRGRSVVKVLTQSAAGVVGAEHPAPLQLRHDAAHELLPGA